MIVALDARTTKLDAALKETNKKLDSLDKQTQKNDSSFGKLTKTANAVGTALTVTATAGLALATALTAVVLKSAASQQELELLSRQAKLSTEDFEALSFATKQYGINAEQIADISKDIADKLGEYSKVGSGAFQDFADVVGLTKEEAMQAASEFENLSSDQVIGRMVSQMEAAGATGNQMTFVLESMGNDLSKLSPLFAGNSKELNQLTSTYAKATKEMRLTNAEIEGLKGVATTFDLMTDSMSKSGQLISASLAPLLDEFFNGVIDVVPEATQTIIDFINAFKSADEIKSIDSMNRLIDDQKAKVQELRMEQNELGKSFATMFDSEKSLTMQKEQLNNQIEIENQRIDELIESRDKLAKQEAEAAKQREGGNIGGTFSPGGGSGGTGDQVSAIADRFKTEEELLRAKLENELLIVGENNELKLQLEQEFQDNLLAIKLAADDEALSMGNDMVDLFRRNQEEDLKNAKKANDQKSSNDAAYFGAAVNLGNAFFEDNKAVRAGLAVVDTAAGITKSFADLPYPAALAASAQIATSGAVQLATISSASKGSSSSSQTTAAQVNVEPEPSSELTISDNDVSGAGNSQQLTIKIESDDTETARYISSILGTATVNGTIS